MQPIRSEPLRAAPTHPDALAIGVAIDGHITATGGKAHLAGPIGHSRDIAALQRLNRELAGHRNPTPCAILVSR
jgi:hypothetical protein